MPHRLQLFIRHRERHERLPRALDRQQLGTLLGRAHELLPGEDGAIAGDAHVPHAVHLLGQGFLADQAAVAAHQHQARLHGIEVHLYPAFGFGANATVGHDQRLAVGHPRDLMRADAVGGYLAAVHQPLTFELIHTQQAAARVGGVVLGGVQPVAALVDHRMAIEMAVGVRGDGLQQPAVAQVDQVALGAWATGDEQRNRQGRVVDDVMAALADLGGKYRLAVQAIADSVVLAVGIIARRQQQRAFVFVLEQRPATQGDSAEQHAAHRQSLSPEHHQSPSLALKPSCTPSALASSPSCRRWTTLRLS